MKVAVAAICASVLLSVLMLVAPSPTASAQQVIEEVCVTGTYVAGECEVRSDVVPECEPGTCAIDVVRPSVPRTETPDRGPAACPDGARGNPELQCFIYVGLTPTGCPTGSVAGVDGNCMQPVANRSPSYECAGDSTLETVFGTRTCVFASDPVVGFCPGTSQAFNGRCVDFAPEGLGANCGLLSEDLGTLRCIEPAELNPSGATVCVPSTRFVDAACLATSDSALVNQCNYAVVRVEELTGDRCLVTLEPLVTTCPDGFSRDTSFEFSSGSRFCVRFAPADQTAVGVARCESGELAADGSRCFAPATLSVTTVCAEGVINAAQASCFRYDDGVPGPLKCPSGAQGPVGGCYYDVTVVSCSDGALNGSLCLVPTGIAAAPGEPVCPVSSTVFLDGDFCYAIVSRPVSLDGSVGPCRFDAVEIDGECRREIALQPGALACENPSHFVVDGQCLAPVPPDAPDGSCPDGAVFVSAVGECHRLVEPVPSFYACADEDALFRDIQCVVRVGSPTATICAAGFVVNAEGTGCARYDESIPGQPGCPPGAQGTSGDCFVDVTPLTCSEGEQTNTVCLVPMGSAVSTPGTCVVGNGVFVDGEFCYRVVDRDAAGNCPPSSEEQNGECRRAAPIRPGPLVCLDPAEVVLSGRCWAVRPADVPSGPCPPGSITVEATGRCRQPVANTATPACADPGAELVDVTLCVTPSDFITAPTQADYVCETGEREIAGPSASDVICIVGNALFDEGSICADGRLLGRSCVWTEPLDEVICSDGTMSIEGGRLCQGVWPANTTYSCATFGDVVTTGVDGTPECARAFGPQPGECPGVTVNGQCYRFVDHTLACALSGCVTSIPAIPAAPAAARGDVDCNGQLNVRDGLLLARTLADQNIERRTLCASANPVDNMRITAADLVQDGTIDPADALRLLQCVVDDNLTNCAG